MSNDYGERLVDRLEAASAAYTGWWDDGTPPRNALDALLAHTAAQARVTALREAPCELVVRERARLNPIPEGLAQDCAALEAECKANDPNLYLATWCDRCTPLRKAEADLAAIEKGSAG